MNIIATKNLGTKMAFPRLDQIPDAVHESFKKAAPFWPLKNLIAVNPLQGLEDLAVEDAFQHGAAYFQQAELPKAMEEINRQTIKWLQVFFDDGQATLPMPMRKQGLFAAFRQLVVHDHALHQNNPETLSRLRALPETSEETIAEYLNLLNIRADTQAHFLTLLLTTLPGWAAHVKYRTEWAGLDKNHPHPVTQADYLALRIVIAGSIWPKAAELIDWHKTAFRDATKSADQLAQIQKSENKYRAPLLDKLAQQSVSSPKTPKAQLVFCIDVRSEPFRRSLEATGDYQTFGFAGFFGIPVQITDTVTGESYASCPVLLSPKHEVTESPCSHSECDHDRINYKRLTSFKRLYQSLKYTFSTPFALVEALGPASGVWMGLRSLSPKSAWKLEASATSFLRPEFQTEPSLKNISLSEQCAYAMGALRMMGLTHHFAPVVVFCGHGSTTENNAYATALDCGACGGRHGASNARILASILNCQEVRDHLVEHDIVVPKGTRFLAAEHNTTTDEVVIYGNASDDEILILKRDLQIARDTNSRKRLAQMGVEDGNAVKAWLRSRDWAQVRPEWGLARNAAFIVGPRDMTSSLDLEGRCFLHSYDYKQDADASALTVILTAPMVVAEWINTQYLFSTLDNTAYGGGSKITKNVTGKIGIMQGNASDLMTGLPLQSVNSTDRIAYHDPQRLMTVVYAPREMIDSVVRSQPVLQKLFGNGWVQLACIEPDSRETFFLSRELTWQNSH